MKCGVLQGAHLKPLMGSRMDNLDLHDDVRTWEWFLQYWLFVKEIRRFKYILGNTLATLNTALTKVLSVNKMLPNAR